MWEWFAAPWSAIGATIATTVAIYITVVVFARFSGVRSFAQMSTFDIAVVIAIGSVIATTAAAQSPPLAQGFTVVVTLYLLQLIVSRLRQRRQFVEDLTDNPPILLMGAGGALKPENMAMARVTEDDLRTHLRQANVSDPATIQAVVMEGTGRINVLHGHDALQEGAWILKGVRDFPDSDPRTEREGA